MEEKQLTEKESLAIITEMVNKVKNHYHENGSYLILWGCVIAFCGLVNFAQSFWKFSIGFDIWILAFVAVVPQVWLIIRENRRKTVKTHLGAAIDAIWFVYMMTIIGVIAYGNITYITSPGILEKNNLEIFSKNTVTGEISPFRIFAPSFSSIFLLVYAFPTLATGLITKYQPLIIGAIVCYIFFIASLFTNFTYDMLFSALAAICCWLIPGLLIRRKYLQQLKQPDV